MGIFESWIGYLGRSAIFRKILHGGAWMAFATIVSQVAGLITSILLARILGVQEFGKYGLLQSTLLTFGALASRSMQVTVTKFLSQYKLTDKPRAGRLCGLCWIASLLSGLIVFGIVMIWSQPLAEWVGEPSMAGLFQVAAITILISSVVAVQGGMILAFQRIKFLAITTIAFSVLNLLLLPVLCLKFGLSGVIWGTVLTQGVNWLINSLLLRKCLAESGIEFTFRGIASEKAILWKFTLPHGLGALINTPVTWFCLMLLARQPNGVAEVAIFSAVERWRKVILFFPGTISKPSIPILAESFGIGNYRRAAKVVLSTLGLNAAICGCIVLALAIGAPYLLALFGAEFRQNGVPTMFVLLIAAYIQAINVPLGDAAATAGRTWFSLIGTILRGSALVVGTLLFISKGSLGLALAHLSSAIVLSAFLAVLTVWILSAKKAI